MLPLRILTVEDEPVLAEGQYPDRHADELRTAGEGKIVIRMLNFPHSSRKRCTGKRASDEDTCTTGLAMDSCFICAGRNSPGFNFAVLGKKSNLSADGYGVHCADWHGCLDTQHASGPDQAGSSASRHTNKLAGISTNHGGK